VLVKGEACTRRGASIVSQILLAFNNYLFVSYSLYDFREVDHHCVVAFAIVQFRLYAEQDRAISARQEDLFQLE
jgi:hypothetical protein